MPGLSAELVGRAVRCAQQDDAHHDKGHPAATRARVASIGSELLLRLDAKRLASLKRDWGQIGGRVVSSTHCPAPAAKHTRAHMPPRFAEPL